MFESFIEKAKETPRQKPITLDLASNMALNPTLLWNKLEQIDFIDDKDLFNLLKGYFTDILDEIFDSKNQKFVGLFTNPKFISALTQVLYNTELPEKYKRRTNKMTYDYLVLRDNKDSYVEELLMAMAKTANRDKIPKLCALGIPESVASLLVMSRYSSEKEIVNVRRLNHILMSQPVATMTEQKIVDIYLALFNHILPLFEGVMLDVVSPQNMSPDEAEIYGIITLAALDLMNELPLASIKHGLQLFIDDKRILYPDNHLRLNLESCSPHDYPRLLTAIDLLKNDGVYIPTF